MFDLKYLLCIFLNLQNTLQANKDVPSAALNLAEANEAEIQITITFTLTNHVTTVTFIRTVSIVKKFFYSRYVVMYRVAKEYWRIVPM